MSTSWLWRTLQRFDPHIRRVRSNKAKPCTWTMNIQNLNVMKTNIATRHHFTPPQSTCTKTKTMGKYQYTMQSWFNTRIPYICHFFTRTHFKLWRFYTWKVLKFTTKLPKTVFFWFFWIFFYTQPKKFYTHGVHGVRDKYQVLNTPNLIKWHCKFF